MIKMKANCEYKKTKEMHPKGRHKSMRNGFKKRAPRLIGHHVTPTDWTRDEIIPIK